MWIEAKNLVEFLNKEMNFSVSDIHRQSKNVCANKTMARIFVTVEHVKGYLTSPSRFLSLLADVVLVQI